MGEMNSSDLFLRYLIHASKHNQLSDTKCYIINSEDGNREEFNNSGTLTVPLKIISVF